jgi:hypothetical protein
MSSANLLSAGPVQAQPLIYEASLGSQGAVVKGNQISQAQAESLRKQGKDVVVCGPDHKANLTLAKQIERNANGSDQLCGPHKNAGPHALPHCHPIGRHPAGHTFYETDKRKAV